MAEKIAPGVTLEGRPPDRGSVAEMQEDVDRAVYRKKRDDSLWNIVMGVALLFASGISIYFAAGGVVMATYGGVRYVYYGMKARGSDDPWKDEEIDQWEREEWGR